MRAVDSLWATIGREGSRGTVDTVAGMGRIMRGVVGLAAVLGVGACSQATTPPAESPAPTREPASVKEADPCGFVDRAVIAAHGLRQASADTSTTSRSCSWTSPVFSAMVLVRWDQQTLVDFSTAFPVLVDEDGVWSGQKAIMGKSDVRPACAGLFFAERGTVVEVVAGDEPPSTADAACERVTAIGEQVVENLTRRRLVETAPPTS